MADHYRCSIVTCARWETDRITEWLLYYASIGFDHVYLYCNDDNPTELYSKVEPFVSTPSPFVTFLHFPFQGQQRWMYLHFLRTHAHASDWVTFLDIDEFLYLPREFDINTYLSRVTQNADIVYFNWLMFGNSGFVERSRDNVIESYTHHEPGLHPLTKLMVRSSIINVGIVETSKKQFWHDWPSGPDKIRRVNVLGDTMDTYYDNFPHQATPYIQRPEIFTRILSEAVVCHFFMQSEADFERRAARGTQGEFIHQTMWSDAKKAGRDRSILEASNAVEFTHLRDYWRQRHTRARIPSVIPLPPGPNVALGKRASQSSTSQWSLHPTREADAAGAVSGKITGLHQFHTAQEENPWWQVDLGKRESIKEVRIYNRRDVGQERARHLTISVSDDELIWKEVYRKTDDSVFGGIDGLPLLWSPPTPIAGRFVRVNLLGKNFLHLDQVEIYAEQGASTIETPSISCRFALCLIVRNEINDLAEWLVHYHAIGVEKFYIYDHNSNDGTTELIESLKNRLPIVHIPWHDTPGKHTQISAYDDCLQRTKNVCEWVLFFDADEFLIPPDSHATVSDLLARCGSFNGMAINWMMFGSSGLSDTDGRPIMEAFTTRAGINFEQNAHVKCLIRPAATRRCVNQHFFEISGLYCDVNGQPITENDWASPGILRSNKVIHGDWHLNHYFVRSRAHWERRIQRKRWSNATNRTEAEFRAHDRNEVFDDRAVPFAERIRKQLEELPRVTQRQHAPTP